MLKTFKRGGIHPNPNKLTAGGDVIPVEAPVMLSVLFTQSIGAPARCKVKPGQHVEAGELIGEAGGFISANVHSPVAGTVRKVEPIRDLQGIWRPGVIIEANPEQTAPVLPDSQVGDVDSIEPAQIVAAVAAAGIVGAGGATFPTNVKLSVPDGKSVDTVIINGAECEPYLTCDDTLMRHDPLAVVDGLRLIMRVTGASRGVIAIENNKKEAIAALSVVAAQYPGLSVEPLRTRYPQGGEKQLIYAVTRRVVPAGALPVDVHVVVDNVATAALVSQAVRSGKPFTSRLVTVTGPELERPGDYLVPVGTPVSYLIELAGGVPADTGKIIAGGPMMGRAVSYPDAPSTKGLSGVLVLPVSESKRGKVAPCIKCGRCVEVCPMGLQPNLLANLSSHGLDEETRAKGVLNCIECGSCSYTCPANRPLLDFIRLARTNLRKKK